MSNAFLWVAVAIVVVLVALLLVKKMGSKAPKPPQNPPAQGGMPQGPQV